MIAPAPDVLVARDELDALLEDVERLRPGLVRHRVLDLSGAGPAMLQALRERFDEAVAAGAGELPLPFPDEHFDLVLGATAPPAEVLRVLRLLGVAVLETDGRHEPPAPAPDRLDAEVAVLERPRLAPGERGTLTVSVTNAGGLALGSPVAPLRVIAAAPGSGPTASVELDRVLLPGDSLVVEIPVTGPAGALGLALCLPGRWGERRSATVPAGGPADAPSAGAVVLGELPRRRLLIARA